MTIDGYLLHKLPVLRLALLLLATSSFAHVGTGIDEEDPASVVRKARDCPQLFGTERLERRNERRRERVLLWAEREASGRVDITHSGNWLPPRRLEPSALHLVSVSDETAVVRVGRAHADLCEPGLYRIEVDDALGKGNRVLAIVGGVVLVEVGRTLAYMTPPGVKRPPWRMVWASTFRFTKRYRDAVQVYRGSGRKGRSSRASKKKRSRRR